MDESPEAGKVRGFVTPARRTSSGGMGQKLLGGVSRSSSSNRRPSTSHSEISFPYTRMTFESRETRGALADLSSEPRRDLSASKDIHLPAFAEPVHKAKVSHGFLKDTTKEKQADPSYTSASLRLEDLPRWFDAQVCHISTPACMH